MRIRLSYKIDTLEIQPNFIIKNVKYKQNMVVILKFNVSVQNLKIKKSKSLSDKKNLK